MVYLLQDVIYFFILEKKKKNYKKKKLKRYINIHVLYGKEGRCSLFFFPLGRGLYHYSLLDYKKLFTLGG